MLYNDDVNEYNSTIKGSIDAWYEMNMLPYDEYLEDTIFCNDRSMNNASTNGWNPDGGMTNKQLQFIEYDETTDLSCSNITDKFSVSNDKAKLTYKVGLMSAPEMNLLNNSNIRKAGEYYWLASTSSFGNYDAYVQYVASLGDFSYNYVVYTNGTRPSVTLAPLTEYVDGDGSMARPFIVN